jgi:hypothetical protein
MDKTISRLNIEHFRKMLATEQEQMKREMLLRLLPRRKRSSPALDDASMRKTAYRQMLGSVTWCRERVGSNHNFAEVHASGRYCSATNCFAATTA